MNPLLQVNRLRVAAKQGTHFLPIIDDVSFSLGRGEITVLLGESGSGKTILSRTLTGLFPMGANFTCTGEVRFADRRLDSLNDREVLSLRRSEIRYIFQDPLAALNPVATIRSQMRTAGQKGTDNEDRLTKSLRDVGIGNPGEVLDSFPHQLSTGMAQRVVIALAIRPGPALLIADEPTSAVDASLRYRLLDLLLSLRDAYAMSILLITHDLRIAQIYGAKVIVLYKGQIVESGEKESFFARPLHPYCQSLLASLPTLEGTGWLHPSAEAPPSGTTPNRAGCRFAHECQRADEQCRSIEPVLETVPVGREIRCHYWK